MRKEIIIWVLALGVFSIINTEMGVIGILPLIAQHFSLTITQAGLLVSLFALGVAISGPVMPLLMSKMNRKTAMLLVLSIFMISNIVSAMTSSFSVVLFARIVPAFFQPVYVSLAFSVASSFMQEREAPKAASKIMLGVSAGMVLGVPIASFIAYQVSYAAVMYCFAMVNAVVLIISLVVMPSMPVKHVVSYGQQTICLKHSLTWISLLAVVCLNGAIFGVYSFITQYLQTVSSLSASIISMLLFLYGMSNMVGNMIAGHQLSKRPIRFVMLLPLLLGGLYIVMLTLGSFTLPIMCCILAWGMLAGACGNVNQYWITSVIMDAPEFGNGLFLSATNLGTTIGTTLCGYLISSMGISSILLGGLLLIVTSLGLILYRIKLTQNTLVKA